MEWRAVPLTLGLSLVALHGAAAGARSTDRVTVYPPDASANVAPLRIIEGRRTRLNFPSAVALDAAGVLYVANRAANSVTVYPRGADGNVAPLRTIAGVRTGLAMPTGIAVDAAGDVFVANRSNATVTVYPTAADGDVAPSRTIRGARTALREPTSIALDPSGSVYVANLGGAGITVYASGAGGDAPPLRAIAGPQTRLSSPFAIAVDAAGRVAVANFEAGDRSRVVLFAAGARGDVAIGAGNLYVSDHGSPGTVLVFGSAQTGNVAPLHSIAGARTALEAPFGLALDSHGNVYVANHSAGEAQ